MRSFERDLSVKDWLKTSFFPPTDDGGDNLFEYDWVDVSATANQNKCVCECEKEIV